MSESDTKQRKRTLGRPPYLIAATRIARILLDLETSQERERAVQAAMDIFRANAAQGTLTFRVDGT